MFFSFLLPCSLFEILPSQGENENFHPDRAPHRDSDHHYSIDIKPVKIRKYAILFQV